MKVEIYNNNDIYEISIEEPANNIKWLINVPILVINDDRIQIDQSIDHMVIKLNLKVNNGDPIMHTYLLSYTEVPLYNLKVLVDKSISVFLSKLPPNVTLASIFDNPFEKVFDVVTDVMPYPNSPVEGLLNKH
jgi:hypothetical protein